MIVASAEILYSFLDLALEDQHVTLGDDIQVRDLLKKSCYISFDVLILFGRNSFHKFEHLGSVGSVS